MSFQQFFGIGYLALALLQSQACAPRAASQNNDATPEQAVTPPVKQTPASVKNKGEQNKMDLMTQKVLAKDPSATLLAKQWGSSAADSLKPLATHEDAIVREIALRCLEQTGGSGVARVFANALLDKTPTVRAAALSGLQRHLDPGVYDQLLNAYDQVQDQHTRREIALLIGRISGAQVSDLRERYAQEQDPLAKEGVLAALAKLGDQNAQAQFVEALRNSRDKERKRYLDYVDYIHQTWAAKALAPVLADKSPLIRIGVDGLPGMVPEYLRACDIAVNLIAKITGASFSFQVNGRTNYTDAQLQEVRRFLDRLP